MPGGKSHCRVEGVRGICGGGESSSPDAAQCFPEHISLHNVPVKDASAVCYVMDDFEAVLRRRLIPETPSSFSVIFSSSIRSKAMQLATSR